MTLREQIEQITYQMRSDADDIAVLSDESNHNAQVAAKSIKAWADALDALLAASPVPEAGWQPIASAPTDGTRVLGCVDGEVRFVTWCKTSHVPLYGWNISDQGVEDFDLCYPTHWMPLPLPPAIPSQKED
jgi:hypothetical protein